MASDEDLFLQVQRGDRAALEVLAHRHRGRVFGWALRLIRDRHAAEDVAQEAFVRLIRAARRYRHPEPFRPWLYAITANLCRDFHKRAYRQREMPAEMGPSAPVEMAAGPVEIAERRAERHQVVQALRRLSPKYREVVALHFYEQRTLREIARICQVPLGTVKSRLSWALRRLRTILAPPRGERGQEHGAGP